jgi:hypothetical protein
MPITPEQAKLSHEELAKDVHMRAAEHILKQVNPSIEFEWVKGLQGGAAVRQVGNRRIIQMEG